MTFDEAKKKIAKLLRLSTSSNQHEAERAASKAAEIMHKYQIEEASLCDVDNLIGRWGGQNGMGLRYRPRLKSLEEKQMSMQ